MAYDVHHPNGEVEKKRPKKTDESTGESEESNSGNRSIQQGNHGIAASKNRMEKWGLTPEELGHSPEEETEEESVVAEALQDPEQPDTIEELWAESFNQEREEKQAQSKQEKVQEITENMGDAWVVDDDESKIDTEELAQEVADKLKGQTVEELNEPSDPSSEATEELTKDSEGPSPEVLEEAASAFEDRGGAWSDVAESIRTEELQEDSPEGNSEEEESSEEVNVVFEELSQGEKKELGDGRFCAIDSHLSKFGEQLAMIDSVHWRDGDKIIYTPRNIGL